MKRSIFILTLLLAVAVFSVAPVIGQCDPAVEICKTPFCMSYPGGSEDLYSTNPIAMDNGIPVYPTHTKLEWWIEIKVTALDNLTGVVVYDRLGAEFMVEGIYSEGQLTKGADEPDLTYAFNYDDKDTLEETITYGQDVSTDSASGTVDKGDMFKGTSGGIYIDDDYDFRIFWTGASCKVHFMWTIGDMEAGDTAVIYLVISTDLNPAGHQEFTYCGMTYLNSGATVKAFVGGRQVSAEAAPIPIKVVDD